MAERPRVVTHPFGAEGLHDAPPAQGACVVEVQHEATGLHAFIALHGGARGRCFGGIRRRAYPSPKAARAEAQALAEAMSWKLTLAGLPQGGGKAVLLDHPGLRRSEAYAVLGDVIEGLGGAYFAGPDMGTGEAELAVLRAHTTHLNAASNDPSASTAAGVLAGIDAALLHLGASLTGQLATVQGLGGVGARVAQGVAARGGHLVVVEPRAAAVSALGVPCRRVLARAAFETPAALHAPCAVGRTLSVHSVARLGARVVCGAANVQLRSAAAADALHRAGVLWCPDWLVNAGAVIEGVLVADGASRDAVDAALAAIGPRTLDVLREAARRDVSPRRVAVERSRA